MGWCSWNSSGALFVKGAYGDVFRSNMVGGVCDQGVEVFVIVGEGAGLCSRSLRGGPCWWGKERGLGSGRKREGW